MKNLLQNSQLTLEAQTVLNQVRLHIRELEKEIESKLKSLDRIRKIDPVDKSAEAVKLQECKVLQAAKHLEEQRLATIRFQVLQEQGLQKGDNVRYQPQFAKTTNRDDAKQLPELDSNRYSYMLSYEGKSVKLLAITPAYKYYIAVDDGRNYFYTVEPWDVVREV